MACQIARQSILPYDDVTLANSILLKSRKDVWRNSHYTQYALALTSQECVEARIMPLYKNSGSCHMQQWESNIIAIHNNIEKNTIENG